MEVGYGVVVVIGVVCSGRRGGHGCLRWSIVVGGMFRMMKWKSCWRCRMDRLIGFFRRRTIKLLLGAGEWRLCFEDEDLVEDVQKSVRWYFLEPWRG